MMRHTLIGLILLLSAQVAAAAGAGAGSGQLDAGMVNPGHHEQPSWFKASFLDIREDVAEARERGKRVLLYFYQDGCPYCAKLLKDNLGDRGIAEATQAAFDVVSINLWGDREVTDFQGDAVTEKRFGTDLRVQFTPTLLFLNEDGRVVLRINGYFPPNKFAAAIDYIAGRQETRQSYSDFLARRQAGEVSARLNTLGDALPKPLRLAENRKTSYRPLLVLFEQTVCPACDELHQDVFMRPEVATSLTNVDVAQLDLRSVEMLTTPGGEATSARDWARALGVQFTPSLVFFDASGDEVFRTEAYLKSFHIHGAIDYVVSGAYRYQPNFQRFLQKRREELVSRGFEVDLMD